MDLMYTKAMIPPSRFVLVSFQTCGTNFSKSAKTSIIRHQAQVNMLFLEVFWIRNSNFLLHCRTNSENVKMGKIWNSSIALTFT